MSPYSFGDATGDYVADTIITTLRAAEQGMSRTDIYELFGKNVRSSRIQQAPELLASLGAR